MCYKFLFISTMKSEGSNMQKNTQVRNQPSKYDFQCLHLTDRKTHELVKEMAIRNDMSISQFIRQAVRRNLQSYAKLNDR